MTAIVTLFTDPGHDRFQLRGWVWVRGCKWAVAMTARAGLKKPRARLVISKLSRIGNGKWASHPCIKSVEVSSHSQHFPDRRHPAATAGQTWN